MLFTHIFQVDNCARDLTPPTPQHPASMLPRHCMRQPNLLSLHLRMVRMASTLTNGHAHEGALLTLADLPKSNNFTSKLPPDPAFPTPKDSHDAPRLALGPRMVRDALYTFVRPVPVSHSELLGVSPRAMKDIGLEAHEAETQDFKDLVAGNKIFWTESDGGIYPWAQRYGGWQFGSWAGQLGDGRAISLFESINPNTKVRFEIQLKGAGKTPYSRFADGKAVLRSSIREFVVSEALNALKIPTTRALSLTLTPKAMVARETMEPGAIVARFAQSWLRIGTFDILRARGQRKLLRQVADYVAEDVFGGWESLPLALHTDTTSEYVDPPGGVAKDTVEGSKAVQENRYARLYREVARRNAKTVAAWQAYGFMNGVLNTDNTSIFGLSLDFGPFAFMDNFDPAYTPNHDDHMLRYSYRNQPSIIWWNLVRLGESLGELIGAGDQVDTKVFVDDGVSEDFAPTLIERAETIIARTGEEFKAVFMNEYKRLMTARLSLKTQKESDFKGLFSELLDILERLELDFNHFFRRLSAVKISDMQTEEGRKQKARIFYHKEGISALGETDDSAAEKLSTWLESWHRRIVEDWGENPNADREREAGMNSVNPKFVPRGWVLDEVIDRVQNQNDREILGRIMKMSLEPFEEEWGGDREEEERFCGDVPREGRGLMCSCSS
jgi:serine/tyrosine/threonine adenylyltransferase